MIFAEGERSAEHADCVGELVFVVEDGAHFVEEEGVRGAEGVGGVEVFAGEGHVVELEVLHAEEELGEVGALEEAGGGGVGGDGLVVFAFFGEGMGEADPGGAEVRVHDGGFGEVSTCFGDAVG